MRCTIKRHPSLQPLSRHHNRGLFEARILRNGGTDTTRMSVEEMVPRLLQFWQESGRQHFQEEEEFLLPIYQRNADPNQPEIVRMLMEHVAIRRMVLDISLASASDQPISAEQLQSLGKALNDHIRFEERVVFPMLEAAIPEEDLGLLDSLLHEDDAPMPPVLPAE